MFSLNAVFATLLDLDDKSVLRIMTFCMAETLSTNSGAVEAIGVLTGVNFGDYWSPDEAFFDILRDKGVVNQMVADIAGKSTAQGCVTDTAKNQKQIIKNRMAPQGHFQEGACHGGGQSKPRLAPKMGGVSCYSLPRS